MEIRNNIKFFSNNYFISTHFKNVLSAVVFISFVLIIWIAMKNIDNKGVDAGKIPNYDYLIANPNERIDEFKKGTFVIDIIERKEFIELSNENNLIKKGRYIKEGNLLIKKF